jgi:hypothetical protein
MDGPGFVQFEICGKLPIISHAEASLISGTMHGGRYVGEYLTQPLS